jgi:hypothetical protein
VRWERENDGGTGSEFTLFRGLGSATEYAEGGTERICPILLALRRRSDKKILKRCEKGGKRTMQVRGQDGEEKGARA